ncbi:PTS sugar transporter subunit IIA [Entomohabitans teleogrylli]|uniref:PTS sugar transporter subunit IIA n=1 Tax=Entomohabitans teleogrylli TaxID=1384589 RepID=UPI00073D98BC|nr:PTS sugar transporter subunit IIA [Entomohabitans teleogrylli]
MPTEIPVILASHGPFAQGALSCAEMLLGKQHNVAVVALQPETNINDARILLADTCQAINQGDGVVILVDMMGGSPCNLASELLLTHDDILLFCGFNIPTLLEVLSNRDLPLQEIGKVIEEVFPGSCFNVGDRLQAEQTHSMDL